MNYFQLLKPVQKLLLNSLVLIIPLLLTSCGKEEGNQNPIPLESKNVDYNALIVEAKELLGSYKNEILQGSFDKDTLPQLAGLYEIERKGEWGIKFVQFKEKNGKIEKTYESSLFEGSLKGCEFKKIKVDSSSNELLYYNSKDLFSGNRIGDVYIYVADLEKKQIGYAHLFYGYEEDIKLYLDKNVTPKIKDYIIKELKSDYQDFKLTTKDNVE